MGTQVYNPFYEYPPEKAALMTLKVALQVQIKQFMEENELNQSKVSRMTGVDRPTINKALSSKVQKISLDKMFMLYVQVCGEKEMDKISFPVHNGDGLNVFSLRSTYGTCEQQGELLQQTA